MIARQIAVQRARTYGMVLFFGLLVSIYTMSHSGKFHVVDEVSLFAVTESIGQRGEVDTNAIAWTQWVNSPGEVLGAFGPDGEVYSKKGPAPAFLAVPWYALLHTLSHANLGLGLLQSTLLWNGFVTAAAAILLWAVANLLGYDDRTGAVLAMLYGLGTIAWPYANQFFGEPLSALSLLFCFYGLTGWLRDKHLQWPFYAGIGAGVAVATVTAHAPLIAALAVYGFSGPLVARWQARTAAKPRKPFNWVQWGQGVVFFLIPFAVAGGLLMWYNQARFGSPFDTGYHFDSGEGFTTPIWQGLWGLVVSPYRGLFWFTPLFFASVAAWPLFRRIHPAAAYATAALSLILILLYSMWWMWWAGYAWGPRFLVPLTPFWVLWLAPWVQTMASQGGLIAGLVARRRRRVWPSLPRGAWAVLVLGALSILVQVGAVSVNFVNYETQLRSIFPTDWNDPLAFGPPAQSLVDFFRSPVFGQFELIGKDLVVNTDLAWLWADGNIQWLLVGVGGAVVATLFLLAVQWWLAVEPGPRQAPYRLPSVPVRILGTILPVLLVTVWMGEVGHNPHYGDKGRGYRGILEEICRVGDQEGAIVTVAPFAYQIPMNWLGGECTLGLPVFGYAANSMEFPEAEQVLSRVLESYNRVWFVTGGMPPNDPDNTLERWLASNAYKANDTWYDDFRLLDYATATQLKNAPLTPLNVTLVGSNTSQITVSAARVSSLSQAGRVLPVEIYYRLQDQNANDLRWFVQLLRPEGYPAALLDTSPEDGYVPFSALPANTDLVERAGLLLPDNLPPGRYELIAGLYNPGEEGAPRLRAADGTDFVRLSYVTVQ